MMTDVNGRTAGPMFDISGDTADAGDIEPSVETVIGDGVSASMWVLASPFGFGAAVIRLAVDVNTHRTGFDRLKRFWPA